MRLRIYETKYLEYYVQFDNHYWAQRPVLEVFDEAGNSLWKAPHMAGLSDLLDSVRYKTSGADVFWTNS